MIEMHDLRIVQLRTASEGGDAGAQLELGEMYFEGRGVARDYAEAFRLFLMAATLGNAEAQYNLGLMHARGIHVKGDYHEAVRWLRVAAEKGNPKAQYNLGLMYYRARGAPLDYVSAYQWVSVAASNSVGDESTAYTAFRDLIARKLTPQQLAQAKDRAQEWASRQSQPARRAELPA